jgi:hypothetical protein
VDEALATQDKLAEWASFPFIVFFFVSLSVPPLLSHRHGVDRIQTLNRKRRAAKFVDIMADDETGPVTIGYCITELSRHEEC